MRELPQDGQQVFVVGPTGAAIEARVIDRDALSTLLAFEGRARDPVNVLAGGHVAIQYTNLRGVCRLDGQAHREPEEGVLRVDHDGKVVLIQRREFVRVDAIVPVTYEPLGSGGPQIMTTTVNVSGGGFMIAGREGLELQDVCDFALALDGDGGDAGMLTMRGRVVRETSAGTGIEIEALDDRERERLIRWVFARERLARQIVGRR